MGRFQIRLLVRFFSLSIVNEWFFRPGRLSGFIIFGSLCVGFLGTLNMSRFDQYLTIFTDILFIFWELFCLCFVDLIESFLVRVSGFLC